MSVISTFRTQASLLWRFMGIFQKPYLRLLHALIVALVILQILSSGIMHVSASGQIAASTFPWLASWYHILAGLLAAVLSCLLTAYSLTHHGLRYFFPYLWGDTEQLKQDIQASLRFRIIPPRPKGLATSVQGLGLGALMLVILSGALWFLLWLADASGAAAAREAHKTLSGLVELYLLGHGGMALLHFAFWQRKTQK